MSTKLTKLPSFSFTNLDFESILADTKTLIKDHPEYNDSWDDFLSSNAGIMILELFAYITEKYCSRVDWISKQLYLSTATDRQAIINILKLINHRPSLPTAAKINVSLTLTKWIEPFYLKNEKIFVPNLNGTMSTFTLLDNLSDDKPDYDYSYYVNTGTEDDPILEFYNLPFYQGNTVIEDDIYMEGLNNEYFSLQSSPVVENSIRIYSISRDQELPEVDSFISPEAQQSDVLDSEKLPPYMIEINDNNEVKVKFGSDSLVKICNKNERLKVTYRVGGGAIHNVVANSVTMTKTYSDTTGRRATGIYGNPAAGFGGTDEEDLEEAKLIAPISLRSANKTVTIEDYVSHLELSPLVMKAHVIGKENEPTELEDDVGYSLPPLDTWIYVVPQKDNWEDISPAEYNKQLKINRPYDFHGVIDYEDVTITALNQSVYLKKYRANKGYSIYITLHDDVPDNTSWLSRDSYIKDTDYTLNEVSGLLTRISTADGGSIPSGDRVVRVRYISDTVDTFKSFTCKQFSSTGTLILDNSGANELCTLVPVVVTDITGKTTYTEGKDYEINWAANKLSLLTNSRIGTSQNVIVQYANGWMTGQNDSSEEKLILETISDKKMICVDNYIKDTKYTTYDVAATITCSKNLIKTIKKTMVSYIRALYQLDVADFYKNISRSNIIKYIMKVDGVSDVKITYLGKNYEAYRRYLLDSLSKEELIAQNANTVEYEIECSYNEILIPNEDEYEGTEIDENKRHGFIFSYVEED